MLLHELLREELLGAIGDQALETAVIDHLKVGRRPFVLDRLSQCFSSVFSRSVLLAQKVLDVAVQAAQHQLGLCCCCRCRGSGSPSRRSGWLAFFSVFQCFPGLLFALGELFVYYCRCCGGFLLG